MIYFLGDIHFSSMNEWSHDIGEFFINWFKVRFAEEDKTNTMIFLGDITEKDSNPGDVIDQMYRLFEFCNNHFKYTYVLMGNHDLKLFRSHTLQTSLKFLNNFKDVKVIDTICGITVEDKNILCMPHLSTGDQNPHRYYNNYDWSTSGLLDKKYQLAIGHWTIKDDSSVIYEDGVDISRIPNIENPPIERGVLCGHIHNRPLKNYIGSIWPAKLDECKCKYPRCLIKWSTTWEEEPLPDFVKFDTIEYGTEIQYQTDCVHLYMITNAPSDSDAKHKYSGFYIKSTSVKKKTKDASDFTGVSDLSMLDLDDLDLFNEMVKERKIIVSRKALKIMNDLLSKRKKTN